MPRFRPRLLHFAIKDRMSKVQGLWVWLGSSYLAVYLASGLEGHSSFLEGVMGLVLVASGPTLNTGTVGLASSPDTTKVSFAVLGRKISATATAPGLQGIGGCGTSCSLP